MYQGPLTGGALEQFERREEPRVEGPRLDPATLRALARRYLMPGNALIEGNRCSLLRDGVEAYPEMLSAIRAAQTSIRLETYMFIDDAVGELFGRALAEAAARGVKVRVLYDWFGSMGSKREFFRALRARGVDIRPFNPLSWWRWPRFRRDHRKLLVVDGEVAFIGGLNIAQHWAPRRGKVPMTTDALFGDGWRDDVLRIEGPAVGDLERRFRATWRHVWRDRLRRRAQRVSERSGEAKGDVGVSVLASRKAIHAAYLRAIAAAKATVMIVACYFVPDRKMLAALRDAALRGVDVKLVMAGKSDHPLITWVSRSLYARMMGWGVKIYEWHQGVLHAKTAVVDGIWGTLGSFNLERSSLSWNHELNVVFADPRVGSALEQSFISDCALCHPIDPSAWARRPWWQRVLEGVAWLFRKII